MASTEFDGFKFLREKTNGYSWPIPLCYLVSGVSFEFLSMCFVPFRLQITHTFAKCYYLNTELSTLLIQRVFTPKVFPTTCSDLVQHEFAEVFTQACGLILCLVESCSIRLANLI